VTASGNSTDAERIEFDSEELVPDAWLPAAAAGPVWAFNPALIRAGQGWLMAYRMILSDQVRRLAMCLLDDRLRVVPGSVFAISDHIRFPAADRYPSVVHSWFADPRLYRWDDHLFLYWNSGWHEPTNQQFLHELDPATWSPKGWPRELTCSDRRPLEKNWVFFQDARRVTYCVYSVTPHRVLRATLDDGEAVRCEEFVRQEFALCGYPPCHGGLRGGAPPVFHEGRFWSFVHSIHDGPDGYRYESAAYCFAGDPPFAPLAEPVATLDLAGQCRSGRRLPQLNPAVASVEYPCGAAIDGDHWLVSLGVNDERCVIARIPHANVVASMRMLG
jgi:hypothetical protein